MLEWRSNEPTSRDPLMKINLSVESVKLSESNFMTVSGVGGVMTVSLSNRTVLKCSIDVL